VLASLRHRLAPLRESARLARLSADPATFRTLRALLVRGRRRPGRAILRLRPLDGASIEIRTDGSDAAVVRDTFVGLYHRPAAAVPRDARLILDLGANIGTTAADFAVRFPEARVVAVELDHETAELCRRNTQPWASRVDVVEGAVWHESGEVAYALDPGEHWGAAVAPGGDRSARAVTIDELLAGSGADVDFMKVDIEGAEQSVFRHAGDWPRRVRVLQVELHGYDVDDCIADLERLGFDAARDGRHWATVVATRR
jgi:FkbM family methyltransferase